MLRKIILSARGKATTQPPAHAATEAILKLSQKYWGKDPHRAFVPQWLYNAIVEENKEICIYPLNPSVSASPSGHPLNFFCINDMFVIPQSREDISVEVTGKDKTVAVVRYNVEAIYDN